MGLSMRVIGRMATLMAGGLSPSKTAADMKATGATASIMAKASMLHQLMQSMMVIGFRANTMGSALSHGLMGASTEVSGGTAKRTARGNSLASTVPCMRESGKTANIMVAENYALPTESNIKECLRTAR